MQSVTSTPLPPASFIFYSIWVGKMLTTQVMFGGRKKFQPDEVHVVKLHIFIVILDQNDNEYMQLDDVHFVGKYIFFPEFSRISGRHPPS